VAVTGRFGSGAAGTAGNGDGAATAIGAAAIGAAAAGGAAAIGAAAAGGAAAIGAAAGAGDAACVATAGALAAGFSPASPIMPMTLLTATVVPAAERISSSTPEAGLGISASTLSVETSSSG